MSVRLALLFAYLVYALSSGGLSTMGSTPPPATSNQPTTDQGSGWDPWG